jgi:hypothetical protein
LTLAGVGLGSNAMWKGLPLKRAAPYMSEALASLR